MTIMRRVVGHSAQGPGCIARLALAIVAEARDFGLTAARPKASRSRAFSTSRYIAIEDKQGRSWTLRVSNHYRPKKSTWAPPHFDLVSLDGSSGLAEARRFLAQIASGQIAWADLSGQSCRPRRKRRPHAKRFHRGDRARGQ